MCYNIRDMITYSHMFRPTGNSVRHQFPDNVYHIYNSIAHSVKFLDDSEKDDLLDRIRRVANFCGLKLLSWCIMTNHFHLLVYLPPAKELPQEEIRRRFSFLRDDERGIFYEGFTRDGGPVNLFVRMCNIGTYMKIVKQNYTLSYNDRTGHRGGLWEGPYKFKRVPMTVEDLSTVAAYQNLNPVRACMTSGYADYRWTSFAAAKDGDKTALEGIDFVFGGFEKRTNVFNTLVLKRESLLAMMKEKMDEDLELTKKERAEAVCRKRLAGAPERGDPLTDEALVAQAESRMERIMSEDFVKELAKKLGRDASANEVKVVRAIAMNPGLRMKDLAGIAGIGESVVKKISIVLQKIGVLRREGTKRRSIWRVM